jgi:RNA polymerase sigma factor (sigma-70 family)
MSETPSLEEFARRAIAGDRLAMAAIVGGLQPDVYGLALRILWRRQDAEDAAQEILVRIVTRLAQYDFQARLRTWAFRVATNYLLDVKKSCVERLQPNFTTFADDLAEGLSSEGPGDSERSVLTEEVKIGCTLGMLQCLDRPHRVAYVLGAILELPASDCAEIMGLADPAFRKRLQRAREAVEAFTRAHCGLVSDVAACSCNRRVPAAVRLGRVVPNELAFAQASSSFVEARALIRRVEQAKWALELHRSTQLPHTPLDLMRRILSALEPNRD